MQSAPLRDARNLLSLLKRSHAWGRVGAGTKHSEAKETDSRRTPFWA